MEKAQFTLQTHRSSITYNIKTKICISLTNSQADYKCSHTPTMKSLTAYCREWFPAPSYTDNIKLEQDQYTEQLTANRTSEMNSTCNVLIHIQVLQLVQIELFLILYRCGYNDEAIRSAAVFLIDLAQSMQNL
jgi:hypothetical protein